MAVPAAWSAALVCVSVVFPVSAGRFFLPALVATLLLWVACLATCRPRWAWRWPTVIAAVSAALVGAALPLTQRGADPDTRPINQPLPEFRSDRPLDQVPYVVRPGNGLAVRPSDGQVTVSCGNLTLDLQPLLTFESRSPDRCWTVLAPGRRRVGPPRTLVGFRAEGDLVLLRYRDDATHVLRVHPAAGGGRCAVEAYSRLPQPVYSHLNTYCQCTVRGHRRLAVAFSPCPGDVIEVTPCDYPLGRPARLAYMDSGGGFRVVEARSGEKGPFRTLARGTLERSQPLGIVLYDDGAPVCRIVLADWARQAGTSLSPTAGWGLPVCAIELARLGDAPDAPAALWTSLAATSVGRGWDSVGHAAGTYRNRLRIEPADE